MAVTFEPILISTPNYPDPLTPPASPQWIVTGCPNNFRLSRQDYQVILSVNNGGFLQITITPSVTAVIPVINDNIALYDSITGTMLIGTLTNVAAYPILVTDIPWVAGMNIVYMNDNTLHGGYYFEGRLTINGVIETLTIIASPDTFGFADLDVSEILNTKTSKDKTGDYSSMIMKEPTKSGKFTFEYRGRWYVSLVADIDDYTAEGNDWYYVEAIRSEDQGGNLHEYVPDVVNDAPFLNSFEQPVYFHGLPFDISFILPDTANINLTVTMNQYSSDNHAVPIKTTITVVPMGSLEGFINSLIIDPLEIEDAASYLTLEIAAS